ncbi:hypothetical protein ASD64_13985 [Mesorhizobium sp. Root157]|uniref:hypothetical protein n=1 Tax=Mesorhizobium sp. Root157 TaxID=1736477 RepID=UPI0006F500A7|nr:hypothetical protein [Mesorhizobium sp. Root157]KQZ99913.1 hypothetical protein ASD64_13985 [Mesorhizobium sp. Root157]
MINAIHTVTNFAVVYVKDWMARASSLRELEQIAPEDRSRTLRDWNLTSFEFGSAMRHRFASQDLLSCAMRTLDIEQDQFSSEHIAWYRDMQRSCVTCPHRSRCRKELMGSSFASHYQGFCANSANFAEILERS